MRTRVKRRISVCLAAAVLALTGACGGSSEPRTTPAAEGPVVRPARGALGTILVDREGRTVYAFANDTAGSSTCTGACASNWPPVGAPAGQTSAEPGVTATLGATTRDDGTRQLTVATRPVYTFAGDTQPGQTNGHGRTLDGGLWTAVSADGTPVAGSAGDSPPPSPGTDKGTGRYGY